MEILLKRSALDRAIPICGESTGEDRHITKATLKWLVQNIRHLVFEVLCCDKWVEQFPALIDHGVNFTAATAEVRVIIECLPKIIDGLVSRFRTSINKDTNFRLESHHV
jgi:hypothetical protein